VDATTKYVPHTNEASKRAPRESKSMQHRFGAFSYFLTVTPDDDNSVIVQVLQIAAPLPTLLVCLEYLKQ
jgi:hypothetical protein